MNEVNFIKVEVRETSCKYFMLTDVSPSCIPLVPTVSKINALGCLSFIFSPLSLPPPPPLSFQINASHLARANSQKVQQAQMVLMHKCNLAKECQRQPRKGSK